MEKNSSQKKKRNPLGPTPNKYVKTFSMDPTVHSNNQQSFSELFWDLCEPRIFQDLSDFRPFTFCRRIGLDRPNKAMID